ncbi:MAG: four helix bundle protein [bacterium]|nr:four helix bundle protein [bacterium]MDT8396910.1 four helix bundle protein [bacterium]
MAEISTDNKEDGFAKSPSTHPAWGAQINDPHRKSLICKERENHAFPFPWSEKSRIGLFATLSKKIFLLSTTGRLSHNYTLRNQIQRASLSVISNITEGFGRHGKQDFRYFLSIANGSANEVRAQLHLIKELAYVAPSEVDELIDLFNEVSRMIKGLRNSIRT